MNSLLQYTVDFKVSRPIFNLEVASNRISADRWKPIHQFVPVPIENDVLSNLVCSQYTESFETSSGRYIINIPDIVRNSMQIIRNHTSMFIEVSLDMKSPRQSKMYKWFRYSMPDTNEFNEVLIMIYKYLLSFCHHSTMKTYDKKHKENALALLEAIMEKYER